MKKVLAIVVTLLMLVTMIAGCAQTATTGTTAATTAASGTTAATTTKATTTEAPPVEPIKIGALLPMSGASAASGQLQLDGYKLFIDRYNEAGGIQSLGGAQIELVLADSQSTADIGVTEFERLVTQENVTAVLGTYNSAVAAACAPIAIKYKEPFMVTNAVNDLILNTQNKYVYRANLGDSDGKETIVGFLNWLGEINGEPITKVAIIYDASDFGQGVLKVYTESFAPAIGAEIIYSEAVQTNSSDLSTVIGKLKASGAQLVIPALYLSDALLFQNQLKEYDCNIPVYSYGAGYLDTNFLKNVGASGEYVISGSQWFPDVLANKSEEARELSAKYVQATGHDMNEAVVNGWLGAAVLIDAIERASSRDTEAIADAMATTDLGPESEAMMFLAYQGVKFDVDGDEYGRYNQNIYCQGVAAQIIDGTWKMIYPDDMVVNNPVVWPVPAWSTRD